MEWLAQVAASQQCFNPTILGRRELESVLAGSNGDGDIQLRLDDSSACLLARGRLMAKRLGLQLRWILNYVILVFVAVSICSYLQFLFVFGLFISEIIKKKFLLFGLVTYSAFKLVCLCRFTLCAAFVFLPVLPLKLMCVYFLLPTLPSP
jgi:hypothetical protein